ncbi:MAG TPA: hypothetical protein VMU65_02960 [Candidatus Saccharimonadales bacterium]|nr:hypothetical protein [Candidatus Saccharimonadales bacterium]
MRIATLGRAAIAAAFLTLLIAAPTHASTGYAFGVAVAPARLEFKVPAGVTALHSQFAVANKSTFAVVVQLSLTDIVIDKRGVWEQLPPGSTPYSFPAVLTPTTLRLQVGETATVRLSAHVSPRPLLGGVLVHPVSSMSAAPGTTGVQINPDILIPLVAAPVDSSGVVQGVELAGSPAGIALPMLVEHGPLAVTSSAQNTSAFYERAFTTVEYANFGHTYLTVNEPPVGVFPGGIARSTASSIVHTDQAGDIDVTPWFGLIKVTTTTHMTLLDSTAPPIVQTAWVLVVPYRVALVLLGLLVACTLGWRWRRRGGMRPRRR